MLRSATNRITVFLAACLLGTAFAAPAARAADACANPRQMDGFKTCADVAKAEEEGSVVVYSPDPETGQAALMAAFHKDFPKIATNFIRLQTGPLYQKLMTERRANVFLVDVLQLTDMGFTIDFQKRNGFAQYMSPEMAAYKPAYKSTPEGYWTWGSFILAGLAYNPNLVKPEDAPKSWKDALDPKWKGIINSKASSSGLQQVVWYEMKKLYGDEYWTKFAELQPRGFDSYVQQFDRMVNGQDALVHSAQYSAYLINKAKGAPVKFVFPTEGMVTAFGIFGVVSDAPHPNAGRLFMDWLLSPRGQKAYQDIMLINSPREDVPPPPGGIALSSTKLLFPDDWNVFLKTHGQFVKEWNKITGVR